MGPRRLRLAAGTTLDARDIQGASRHERSAMPARDITGASISSVLVPQALQVAPGPRPLGTLVVAIGQALPAPYCSSHLADAGARVMKVEHREGDFTRGYDRAVHGESSYWVGMNHGEESIALGVKDRDDPALVQREIDRADVFIQNLTPGAIGRLGVGAAARRRRECCTHAWSPATSPGAATTGPRPA